MQNDYNQSMIQKYENSVYKERLGVFKDSQLTSLGFLDLLNVKSLYASECDNITFKHQSNIEQLHIQDSMVNLKHIHNLIHLKYLKVSEISISDFKPLKKLANIVILNLNKTHLKNLKYLSSLQTLTELYANQNEIADVQLIKSLKELKILNLSHNQLKDVANLKYLTKLEQLSLQFNEIIDISFVKHLPAIKQLQLQNNKIMSVQALEFANFNELNLKQNYIQNFNPICKHKKYIKESYNLADQNTPTNILIKIQMKLNAIHNAEDKTLQMKILQTIDIQTMKDRITKSIVKQYDQLKGCFKQLINALQSQYQHSQ
ncbi:GA_module-containing protein [Hexamita inflata]|uniref:GA module-containing protein n=1 Tax=Hexamita inflata TaxID=28002 RepID=A0AA86QKC8_9EUKA|nr:GA module-containing protein [Hexamita inflata]